MYKFGPGVVKHRKKRLILTASGPAAIAPQSMVPEPDGQVPLTKGSGPPLLDFTSQPDKALFKPAISFLSRHK